MTTLTEAIFGGLSRIYWSAFGNRTLRPYEAPILNAWRETLSPDARRILDEQLAAKPLIQRQAGDAKVCFFHRDQDIPLFGDCAPDLHVATASLFSSDDPARSVLRVKRFLHRGRLFSMEFPGRPRRCFERHHIDPDRIHISAVDIHAAT